MNIKITLTNKTLYSILIVGIFLLLIVGVLAFNPDMNAGDPTVFGHSAGEIMVNNSSGDLVSLQNKIDSGIDFIEFNETTNATSSLNWMSACTSVVENQEFSSVNLDGYNICFLTHYEVISSSFPYPVNCYIICLK